VDLPAKQDESDTPVGVLAWLSVHSYIGKPNNREAAGWGRHSRPCADVPKGSQGSAAVPDIPVGLAGCWDSGCCSRC